MSERRKKDMKKIKVWAYGLINPMFSIYGACREILPDRWGLDSTCNEYRYVYRLLESMVESGELYAHGSKNGGNIYMLKNRDIKSDGIPF